VPPLYFVGFFSQKPGNPFYLKGLRPLPTPWFATLGHPDSVATVVLSPPRGNSHSEEGVVSMKPSKWTKLVLATTAASVLCGSATFAQSGSTDEGKRKIKSKISPVYPELARRMNVSGKVKIEVVITADGKVKSFRTIGGHPLLVQVCQDAVKDWKFMPGTEETTQIVEFDFHSAN
jgi:TonB family protein